MRHLRLRFRSAVQVISMSTIEISTTMREDAMRRPLIVLGALWLILAVVIAASQLLYPPPIEVEWRTETEVNLSLIHI